MLLGPDERTRITPATRQALFYLCAPAGIPPEAVERHLADITSNVRLVAPGAAVIQQQVYAAG